MLEPENEDGNIEYKLKLLDVNSDRKENLITQMRRRCIEGNGECIYILGVEDSGTMTGISEKEYEETLENIKTIAITNAYFITLLSKKETSDNKFVYEVLIREKNENKYIDIKIAVAGNCDAGKCLSGNTPIIMYDGKIKMIQDIKKGDLLMGDDSTPRTVLNTTTGSGELYEIIPLNGDSYKVNKNHILCFKISSVDTVCFDKSRNRFKIRWMELINNIPVFKEKRLPIEFSKIQSENELKNIVKFKSCDIVELTFEQYINLPTNTKNALKLYKTGIKFPAKDFPIDPYMIGYWLGDGTETSSDITTQDSTIIKYFKTNLEKYKCYLQYRNSKYSYRINGTCKLNGPYGGSNFFLTTLKNLNLIDNKHIPDIYKYNSRENRLKLLAGLIDSDGSYQKGRNIFEFSQSLYHEKLMDDVIYLSRSLGFACYKNKKNTTWTYKGIKKTGEAWRINIMGEHIEEIPTLCPRKKANKRRSQKNVLLSGIDNILISKQNEKYYGFELDGNGRFLLGDFSVTHNSSLIGTLISGEKDNGRGLARSHVFVYPHELQTGRTSAISHQIIGYDYEGKIVNYQGLGKLSWQEIVQRSSKIISILDLAGHEKYLKTTILGLAASFPDICMIIIDANNGIKPMTKEHILLCVTLKIPFIIVVTKIDICKERTNILQETKQSINKFLKYPGIRRLPFNIKSEDDILTCIKNIYTESITPIFYVSNTTGEGIDYLKYFFNIINKRNPERFGDDFIEFHIDHVFSVYGFGTVLGGHLIGGTVKVGDKLLIGPNNGEYENVIIRSIYCKKICLQSVQSGSYVCLGIKKIDKNNIKRGNVIISQNAPKLCVKTFSAKITVLKAQSTTIRVGYEPILHCYAIRQVIKILNINDKKNSRNITIDDDCLRNGDSANVVFNFKYNPQYLKIGSRFILCEGKTKVMGEVTNIL